MVPSPPSLLPSPFCPAGPVLPSSKPLPTLPVVVEDIELGSRHDTRPGAEIDVVQEMTMQLAPMFARSEQLTSQRAVASSSVLSPTRSNWDNTLSTETPGGTQHSV